MKNIRNAHLNETPKTTYKTVSTHYYVDGSTLDTNRCAHGDDGDALVKHAIEMAEGVQFYDEGIVSSTVELYLVGERGEILFGEWKVEV